MKKHTPKKVVQKSSKTRSIKRRSVALVHADKPLLKHLRLVSHKHTGSVIHVRHTSHLALFMMLVFVGFFLVISQNFAHAGDVTVGVVVKGPPPSVGAVITSPVDGINVVNLNPTPVSGTCAHDSFVVIYNDGTLSSSTICASDGTFTSNVQLHEGTNALTAKNFDNLNQPGPITPTVNVTFSSVETVAEVAQPSLPENPVIIPGTSSGISECDEYDAPAHLSTGGSPHVAVVCVPRTIEKNNSQKVGVLVWGGTPPYALSFDWGSGDSTLLSVEAPGYKTVKVHYASSGIYTINVKVTDQGSNTATGESAIQVTDTNETPSISKIVNDVFTTSWFQTPVPLYVIAVGLTLGFWAGDIFNRRFGARTLKNYKRRARKA